MAIRKVGNIYSGGTGLRKVGNVFDSSEDQKKKEERERVIKESQALAEQYSKEATTGILNRVNQFVDPLVGGTKAAGASFVDMLTPWDQDITPSVRYQGIEYKTPAQKGREGGSEIALGHFKKGFGQVGEGVLDVAQFLPIGGAVARGAKTGFVPLLQQAKNLTTRSGALSAGKAVLKNKSIQQNAALMGGYGVTGAMQEEQGAGGIALEGLKGIGLGAGFGLGFEGLGAIAGRGFTKLFEKLGTRPRQEVVPEDFKEVLDEFEFTTNKPATPQEEDLILEALSKGATKEEIITEIGKAKVEVGMEKPSLSQIVDELEMDGKKLTLEETMQVKEGLDEGKSLGEIKATLEGPESAQKGTQKPSKPESDTQVPDDQDEAFLKSVEERFQASKREKFRDATQDEKGRFTGSRRGVESDAQRDDLAESIQNRIDSIEDDSVSSFIAREELREIQEKVARAKNNELEGLKAEAEKIAQEVIQKRAEKVKPVIQKDKKLAAIKTIAQESEDFTRFQLNLKKRGESIVSLFKSKAAAEEFYAKTGGAKYRLAEGTKGEEIVALAKAEYAPYSKKTVTIGKASEAAKKKIKETTGIDVSSYDHEVDQYALQHALKKHSNDELPLTTDDFSKIPDILENADDVQLSRNTKQGLKALQYKKAYNGTTYYVEEVRTGRGTLSMKTMYKTKTPRNGANYAQDELSSVRPSHKETTTPFQDVPDTKVPDSEANVNGKKRLIDDFERIAGVKITPEQEAKIIALNKKLFGDENVEVTAQLMTPKGQKAFGEYKNKVIKILDGQADPKDTFYHEAVHKYLDLFTTLDEQKKIYLEARKLWKTDNLDELEEQIAENFIRYAKENEGVVGSMKVLFDKVLDRIKVALKGESQIEALYRDILEGKATERKSAKVAKAKGDKSTLKGSTEPKVIVPAKEKVSFIASRLNKDLPDDFKIDETYSAKNIKEEITRAANAIEKNKAVALKRAFDPNTNPVERDAILIELSEIAKRDGDWATVADLFQKRSELIRASAQALNMEKASILLNPEEAFMRKIVNARLAKVKVDGKDLTDAQAQAFRRRVKGEVSEVVKQAYKIQDAQELFNSLICK